MKDVPKAEEGVFAMTAPDEIVAFMPKRPEIKHGMTAAYYAPRQDIVGMPEKKRFENEEAYHAGTHHITRTLA